jgi:glycyl-tRNA synthetase alpha subunit
VNKIHITYSEVHIMMLIQALVELARHTDATNILSSITYSDVKDFLERQKSRQFQPYRGCKSYVAHDSFTELQCEIADVTASGVVNDDYRYLFVAIDVFAQFSHAVPIRSKTPSDSVGAMQ